MKTMKRLLVISLVVSMFLSLGVQANALTILKRLSGSDRYKTSIEISKSQWGEKKYSDYAVLATGEDFPDALSSVPLAKKYNAPILLTQKESLNSDVKEELIRLKVKCVYIAGGTSVISSNVEDTLKSMNIEVTRLAGNDRYETSIKIAEKLESPSDLVITTGDDFTDALSVSPFAAIMEIPIILVPKDNVPQCISDYIAGKSIKTTYVLGGADIISETSANQFPNPYRINGADKYERNIAIVNSFRDEIEDMYLDTIYIATGEAYPDALSGSVIASINESPIILVNKDLPEVTKKFLTDNRDSINRYSVFGGESAVDTAVVNDILSTKNTKKEDKGIIENSVYKNEYFGVTMNLPPNWLIEQSLVNLSSEKSPVLLSISRYPFGTEERPNYNLLYLVEGVNQNTGTNTNGNNNIFKDLERMGYIVDKNVTTKKLGDATFYVLRMERPVSNKISIKQSFYITLIKGYVHLFVLTYTKDSELKELEEILNTIKAPVEQTTTNQTVSGGMSVQ